jgi:IS1 family transposase
VALDPDSRLVLSVLVGKRLRQNAEAMLRDVKGRLAGTPALITTDEWSSYPEAIREVFGREVVPQRTGKPGRPRKPHKVMPEGLNYATVCKRREGSRVAGVITKVVMGALAAVLALLGVGKKISTSYIERQNATDRHRNARKGRKTYRFSKDLTMHESMTHFTMYSYNFCWPVRTLRVQTGPRRYQKRTPAMAAGLTDHVWTLQQWLAFPACQRA